MGSRGQESGAATCGKLGAGSARSTPSNPGSAHATAPPTLARTHASVSARPRADEATRPPLTSGVDADHAFGRLSPKRHAGSGLLDLFFLFFFLDGLLRARLGLRRGRLFLRLGFGLRGGLGLRLRRRLLFRLL